jgi:hypothetical protein
MKTNDAEAKRRKSKRRCEKNRRVNPFLYSEPDERKKERRDGKERRMK